MKTNKPKSMEKIDNHRGDFDSSNILIYFYVYLVIQLIYIVANSYLPIYFFEILNVDKTQLAFVQIISYSAYFIKPLISIFFDRRPELKISLRFLLILLSLGLILSFLISIVSMELLLVFGIFLGLNFAFSSVIDVIIKKVLIKKSGTGKEKNKNVLFFQIGSLTGALLPPLFSLFLSWNIFFLILIIVPFPLILIIGLTGSPEYSRDTEILNKESFTSQYSFKNIILMCLAVFFIYGDNIYEYPLEPYIVSEFGQFSFDLILMCFILINTAGIVIAGLISHKWNNKTLLIYNMFISGVFLLLTPFVPVFVFLILYAILQIVGGFIVVNLISLMIDMSKGRVTIYQTIAVFFVLAKVILVPLGTLLSAFIEPVWIIFIGGFLFLLSVPTLLNISTEEASLEPTLNS